MYNAGYKAGQKDAELISNPINTNGHTYEEYLRVKELYNFAINPFRPTCSNIPDEWFNGYAQGFDDWCIENKNE